MPEVFEVAELVKIAVEDEKTGVAFYSILADKASSDWLKKTFAGLADQERYHQKRFEQMLESLGGHHPVEEYTGQYMDYLRALTDGRAFPDVPTAEKIAHQCKGDKEALDLSGRFERDTIILMNEMRGLVSDKHKAIVDELILEEQGHLVVLANARRKLS